MEDLIDNRCQYSTEIESQDGRCPSYNTGECNNNCYKCIDELCKQMERTGEID